MENRMNYITSLKDGMSSRNSFAVPTQPTNTQQALLHDNMQYQVIRQQIKDSQYYNKTTKHTRIRLEKWLSYLDKIKTNKVWLKSRNTYIKILNLMCYCQCILAPFNQLPPDEQLPTLSKNQVNRIIDQIERQLKQSNVTRRASQNIEITKQFVQNEMENIIFPTFSQKQKRFHTNQSNSFFEDDSSTLPLKAIQINQKKHFETEVQQITLPLKIQKQSYYQNTNNYIQSRQKSEASQVESICQRSYSLTTKRNSKHKIEKQNNVTQDTLASINSYGKFRKNTLTPTKTIALREIKLNDIKRPNIPLKLKNMPNKFKQSQNCKEDSIQKQYWQQNSLLSRGQSHQNTPKYINNFTSQLAVSDKCVQIMSFRQKEEEICDCTSNILGGGWLSELFKKINI